MNFRIFILIMNAKIGIGIGFGVILVFLLSACLKKSEFPLEPIIAFKEFTASGDSGHLVITFTDGDGDIGLADGDTNPPYDLADGDYYNLLLDYYELQDGTWVNITDSLPLPYYYRVPVITPSGQNKALEGEIAVDLVPTYYNPFSNYDTIKFSVQLLDRALNRSNIVETDEIIVP
mgnify:CR=1 FL=1